MHDRRWTNRSAALLAGDSEPVDAITEQARRLVLDALASRRRRRPPPRPHLRDSRSARLRNDRPRRCQDCSARPRRALPPRRSIPQLRRMIRPAPPAGSPETLLQTGLSQPAGCPSPLFGQTMKHPQPLPAPSPGASPLTLQGSPRSGSSPRRKTLGEDRSPERRPESWSSRCTGRRLFALRAAASERRGMASPHDRCERELAGVAGGCGLTRSGRGSRCAVSWQSHGLAGRPAALKAAASLGESALHAAWRVSFRGAPGALPRCRQGSAHGVGSGTGSRRRP